MLKPVYFAGHDGPCDAQYGLHLDRNAGDLTLHIIVIQSQSGSSLWNSAEGRNDVLNLILSQSVARVRIDQIRYHVILDLQGGMRGLELPVHADMTGLKRGNGVEVTGLFRKVYRVWNDAHVTGSARCYVDFNERRQLSDHEMERFCAVLGYYSPHRLSQLSAPAPISDTIP